ncbi:hypothetical protein DFP73DRAFT_599063 [Morchella snyderi]|nr:hypothetical protein DFP73DRAFT_599063 [Morchella snyderi]
MTSTSISLQKVPEGTPAVLLGPRNVGFDQKTIFSITRHPTKPLLRREERRLLDDETQLLTDEGNDLADNLNSDLESLSDESVNEENEQQPSKVTTFPRADEILGDVQRLLEDESNLWAPFESQQDFDLVKWQEVSYNSAYKLCKKIDGLSDGLGSSSWMTGQVDFQPPEDDMRPFGDSSDVEDESQRRSTTSTPFFLSRYSESGILSDQTALLLREHEIADRRHRYPAVDLLRRGTTNQFLGRQKGLANLSHDRKHRFEDSEQAEHARKRPFGASTRLPQDIIDLLFEPLREASSEGIDMECSDGFVRRCFSILCAWIAGHKENMTLHNITGNLCPVCEADESKFGELKEGEAGEEEELKARGIKQMRGVLWNIPFVDLVQLPKPDILHVLYLGFFKHMMDWLMAFLKKHKRKDEFDTIWARIPPYPGFNAMNKPFCQVSQWQGKEMRNLVTIPLPTLAAILRHHTAEQSAPRERWGFWGDISWAFTGNVFLGFRGGKKLNREARMFGSQLRRDVLEATSDEEEPPTAKRRRLVDAERLAIDSQVLEYTRDRSDFNFPKMHMLSHFRNHVIKYGSIPQFSSELGEASHKARKVGYKRSNKVDASEQILTHIATVESFAVAELNLL